jgi:hypothetical protein
MPSPVDLTHKRIVGLIAFKNLPMDLPLIVVPDLAAGPRKHCFYGEQQLHLLWLKMPRCGLINAITHETKVPPILTIYGRVSSPFAGAEGGRLM